MPAMDAMLCWRCGYWEEQRWWQRMLRRRVHLRMSVNIFSEAKPDISQVRCKRGRIGHKCLR